jgi:SLT domain-containing protein
MMGGGSSSGGGSLTPAVQQWFGKAVMVAGVPASWIPDLETIAQHESSFNPSAVNLTDSNAAAGDPSKGIMQLIGTTFDAYHNPRTSPNIWDPVANIAASIGYIRARYGTVANVPGVMSLGQGGKYVGYDNGGALPPGLTMAVNQTGRPEAVLTADDSAALKELVRELAANRGATTGAPMVTQVWNGPQMPSQETLAEMERHLSLMLG